MPLYEYECQQCHKHTEKRQKFSDPEITECPFCRGPLQRVLSAPAFSFAGGGWYKDLYSSAKPAATNTGESATGKTDAKVSSSDGGTAPASAPAASSPSTPAPAAPATSEKK